jgi:sodium-dependent dicarboxylate transporter 2/3/5
VSTHYLLPIHHVTVMIGAGKGYYSQRETLTFGLVLSLLVPAAAALLYIPWWRVIGAL